MVWPTIFTWPRNFADIDVPQHGAEMPAHSGQEQARPQYDGNHTLPRLLFGLTFDLVGPTNVSVLHSKTDIEAFARGSDSPALRLGTSLRNME